MQQDLQLTNDPVAALQDSEQGTGLRQISSKKLEGWLIKCVAYRQKNRPGGALGGLLIWIPREARFGDRSSPWLLDYGLMKSSMRAAT